MLELDPGSCIKDASGSTYLNPEIFPFHCRNFKNMTAIKQLSLEWQKQREHKNTLITFKLFMCSALIA
jgi:hypothetical protein